MSESKKTAWLIERFIANKLYFYAPGHIASWGKSQGVFSSDPNDALGFAREKDALQALHYFCNSAGRIAEHIWIDGIYEMEIIDDCYVDKD